MGVGPIAAIPEVLEQTGLSKDEGDLWEIDEAFASQYAYRVETIALPIDKVNSKYVTHSSICDSSTLA